MTWPDAAAAVESFVHYKHASPAAGLRALWTFETMHAGRLRPPDTVVATATRWIAVGVEHGVAWKWLAFSAEDLAMGHGDSDRMTTIEECVVWPGV